MASGIIRKGATAEVLCIPLLLNKAQLNCQWNVFSITAFSLALNLFSVINDKCKRLDTF